MKRMLCFLLTLPLCLFLFSGCASKTAKVLVSSDFADSALLAQLMQAFHDETGYTVKLDAKDNNDAENAVKKGNFDAALLLTQSAYEKLGSGEFIGGNVFLQYLISRRPHKRSCQRSQPGQLHRDRRAQAPCDNGIPLCPPVFAYAARHAERFDVASCGRNAQQHPIPGCDGCLSSDAGPLRKVREPTRLQRGKLGHSLAHSQRV